jgi:hypothetical protein
MLIDEAVILVMNAMGVAVLVVRLRPPLTQIHPSSGARARRSVLFVFAFVRPRSALVTTTLASIFVVPRHTFAQIIAPGVCLYTNGYLKRSASSRTQAKIDLYGTSDKLVTPLRAPGLQEIGLIYCASGRASL